MKGVAACLAAGIVFAAAATAHATTWCVKNPTCPAGGNTSHATVTGAVLASADGDTVLVGPGTFHESVPMVNHGLAVRGAGPATIIQAPGPGPATTFALGSQGYLNAVKLVLAPGSNNVGLDLEGTASGVVITAPAGSTTGLGVRMIGGTLEHSLIELALGGASTAIGAQLSPLVVAGGDIQDTSITAAIGADGVATLVRDRIHATVGFTGTQGRGGTQNYTIQDTLITTEPGSLPERAVRLIVAPDATSNTALSAGCACLHDTFFGSGMAGSIGFLASAAADASQFAFSLNAVDETIIRGYATSVYRTAAGTGNSALANVPLRYSDFDPGTEQTTNSGTGTGVISANSTDINRDPLFANTNFDTPGSFWLRVGSPAIDAGPPAEPGNTSPVDLAGAARDRDGRNTGDAVADMGAYEYQPHFPRAVVHAPAAAYVRSGARFSAVGSSDVDLGDRLRFSWSFDDGTKLPGEIVRHAFTTAGSHIVHLTVTDFYGRSSTELATVEVTVRPPRLTQLRISRQLVITYRDSRRATTTFSVFARRSGHLVRVRRFQHQDRSGLNRLRFRPHGLAAGPYVLQAVPRSARQAGRTVSAGFMLSH